MTSIYVCDHYDCGWCYAPDNLITTDKNGACNMKESCPQSSKVNINDPSDDGDDSEEHY